MADWADARLGTKRFTKTIMRKVFPDHWSFLLGEIAIYSFLILLVTGLYLSLYFEPSMKQVDYHGSYAPLQGQMVSEAFNSTMHISFDVRGGLLIRQVHHWAALIFVSAIVVHMMRVFFSGAFRKPRELRTPSSNPGSPATSASITSSREHATGRCAPHLGRPG